MTQVVTRPDNLKEIYEEVQQALRPDDAVGIVVVFGNNADFISKNDRGLVGKVVVGVSQGTPPVGVLFVKENLGKKSGRYQLFSWSKDDQHARLLVEKVLDKILINGNYDPLEDLPEPTSEQKAANRAELNRMRGKTTISCSRCGGKNPAHSEHCYKCGQTIAGAPNDAAEASALHGEPQGGTQSLGDLSGIDTPKLREELREKASELRGDKDAQDNALDEPHHLIFFSAVGREGETRFFDIMPQGDGFSIAETATKAEKLGQCVETAYGYPGGAAHHVHRLYGKFLASTARKAMERFSELTGLSQVTEIAETQTQREALPTWRFIFERLGAVPNQDSRAENKPTRESCSKAETNARSEGTSNANAKLVQGKVTSEEASGRKSPSGIGGWLAVFVLGLFGNGAMLSFESLNLPVNTSNALGMGIGLCLAALAFSSGVLILRKNPRGILLSKVFIGSNLLVSVLAVIGSIGDAKALGAVSADMGRVLLFSLVWITYLQQSVRVKNTFGSKASKVQSSLSDAPASRGKIRSISTALISSASGKTTKKIAIALLVLAVLGLGLCLFVTVLRNYSDNRAQLQNQIPSSEQPKTDYVALAKQTSATPGTSTPKDEIDLSAGLVPKQPDQTAPAASQEGELAKPIQPGQQGFDFGFAKSQAQSTQPPSSERELSDSQSKDLQDTLQWLQGASDNESATGIPPYQHYTFEIGGENGCSVAITETRAAAGPEFWIKESFSLGNIDPADIQVNKLGKGAPPLAGESAVRFHTTNYRETIVHTSNTLSKEILTSDYTVFTNDWFAPRFAKALKHAATLCGARPSRF